MLDESTAGDICVALAGFCLLVVSIAAGCGVIVVLVATVLTGAYVEGAVSAIGLGLLTSILFQPCLQVTKPKR